MTDLGPLRRLAVTPAVLSLCAVLAGCGGATLLGDGPAITPDPGVRGDGQGYFLLANGEPTIEIGSVDPDATREAVDGAAAVIDEAWDDAFYVTLVAAFDAASEAETAAAEIRSILEGGASWYADPAHADDRRALDDPDELVPMIPPDAAAMKAHLLAAGDRGVGWGGRPGDAEESVFTLGPLVVVTGLETEPIPYDVEPPLHPLAHLLAAEGADVLLEGDRGYEGSIVVDASCRIRDPAAAEALRDEIGDAIQTAGQFSARPPWIGPPPNDAERLARATYRRWTAGMAGAIDDPAMYDMALGIARARNPEEREAAMQRFGQRLVERGLAKTEGELDPATLALLLSASDYSDDEGRDAWRRDLGERMGRLPVVPGDFGEEPTRDDADRLAITGSVRIRGERLEFAFLQFGRAVAGLPYLAAYLADHGCDDLRVGLVDAEKLGIN